MKRNSDAGQALVVVALMLVVLLSVMGLAVDMGYLRYMRRQLQTAADAAAIAGALEINSCGGSPGCSNLVDAAHNASGENGFTAGTKGVTVTVNNPPTTTGDPHNGDAHFVEVIVSQPEPSHFANMFGVASTTLSARGEAKMTSGNCVYSLNNGLAGSGNLNLLAALDMDSQCGIVVESSLNCVGGSITAPRIGIGGGGGFSFACSTNPTPVHIATPTPADPLAYLPKPAVPACGTTTASPYSGSPGPLPITVTGAGNVLNPGNYCGGIVVAPGATVTLSGSTTDAYVLTSTGATGGLTVAATATVTGSNVTFYNLGPNGAITFLGGTVNLAAPTSGPHPGVLFFQDSVNTNGATFAAAFLGSSNLSGAYYFPNADLAFALDLGASSAYTILVARSISFTATDFTIKNDYSSLADGSPVKDSAALVE
jgi:Putative Flp pilus-assembly TadE/G-like